MDAAHFPNRLRELRNGAGWTQRELADRAGVSSGAICHWEQGIREPSITSLVALAQALGVDCQAFLELAGELTEPKRIQPPKALEQELSPKRPR
jgi:transcriptional regulator with XRE-family HTH domain